MKPIRIAGLCLVAMFAMSMAAAGTASAGVWEHCETTEKAGTATRFETNQCKGIETGGKYTWQEVTGTEAVRGHGSLRLTDTGIPFVEEVGISCSLEEEGFVGPKNLGRITEIPKSSIHCTPGENCEEIEGEVKPLNLPWRTEIAQTEGGRRDYVKAVNGAGAGWAVTCRVGFIPTTDECTTEEASTALENVWTHGVGPGHAELLVSAKSDEKTKNAKCALGGAGSGEVRGSEAILQTNGHALRVT